MPILYRASYCASCMAGRACEVGRVIAHVKTKEELWKDGGPAGDNTLKDCRHEAYKVWALFHGRANAPVQPLPVCADLGIKVHFYEPNAAYRGFNSIHPSPGDLFVEHPVMDAFYRAEAGNECRVLRPADACYRCEADKECMAYQAIQSVEDETDKAWRTPSNTLRYLAYRKLARLFAGYWEKGVRKPFPICCDRAIKEWAPSPHDKYSHFRLKRTGQQRSTKVFYDLAGDEYVDKHLQLQKELRFHSFFLLSSKPRRLTSVWPPTI